MIYRLKKPLFAPYFFIDPRHISHTPHSKSPLPIYSSTF